MAPNALIANLQDDFDYEAALGGLGSAIPPDPAMGAGFYRSSGLQHFWNVKQSHPATPEEARLDSLFEKLVSTPDLESRRHLSAEMERVIGEACWVIWLPVNNVRIPIRDRFGNLEPSTIRHRVLWNSETIFVRPAAKKS